MSKVKARPHEPAVRSTEDRARPRPVESLLDAQSAHACALDLLGLMLLYRRDGAFTPDSWTL